MCPGGICSFYILGRDDEVTILKLFRNEVNHVSPSANLLFKNRGTNVGFFQKKAGMSPAFLIFLSFWARRTGNYFYFLKMFFLLSRPFLLHHKKNSKTTAVLFIDHNYFYPSSNTTP